MFVLSLADLVWPPTGLDRPNRRCSAIGETRSEWGSRCGRYGTRICRCCSSSGRIRSPHTWPPLQRPTTWTGTHSSAAGRGYEPTRRCSPGSSSSTTTSPERSGPGARYWIGRSYWGKGIATDALTAFLAVDRSRPLNARVASDNVASRRVLEKCGFRVIATERNVAEGRSAEIEELVLRLDELASTDRASGCGAGEAAVGLAPEPQRVDRGEPVRSRATDAA